MDITINEKTCMTTKQMDTTNLVQNTFEIAGLEIPLTVLIGASILAILLAVFIILIKSRKSKGDTILFVGLCGSGKTVLFCQLHDGTFCETHTSMKENEGTFPLFGEESNAKHVHIVDIPGHYRLRPRIQDFLPIARAIIFTVDAVDFQASQVADYLYSLLVDPKIANRKLPIMITCNKMDLITATNAKDIQAQLEKELEHVRKTRTSSMENTEETGEVYLGIEGEPFKFEHLNNHISFVEISAKNNDLKPVREFIRKMIPK